MIWRIFEWRHSYSVNIILNEEFHAHFTFFKWTLQLIEFLLMIYYCISQSGTISNSTQYIQFKSINFLHEKKLVYWRQLICHLLLGAPVRHETIFEGTLFLLTSKELVYIIIIFHTYSIPNTTYCDQWH